MAIDTNDKKFSVLDWGSAIQDGMPVSPGALAVADQWHLVQEYSDIGGGVVAVVNEWIIRARRRMRR